MYISKKRCNVNMASMPLSTYKRNINVYGMVGKQQNRKIGFEYIDSIIDYIVKNMYPINTNTFASEQIPIITEKHDLNNIRNKKTFGLVYGYLRHEGLSAIFNKSTRKQMPLTVRLNEDEDIYEYAHLLVMEPGIILKESTVFVPRHGVLSKLLTSGAVEYCKKTNSLQKSIQNCNDIDIYLKPLYRENIHELISEYENYPIRAIRIKIEVDRLWRISKRTAASGVIEKIERLLNSLGIHVNVYDLGATTIDTTISVGRSRKAELGLNLGTLVALISEIKESEIDIIEKFTVRFGEKGGTVDLIEDMLVFKEIPIPRAVVNNRVHRSTDTTSAFKILRDLAFKNYDIIMSSFNSLSEEFYF